ncbi:MAG: hypothetical protein ACYTEL_20635, partial [Planctomycetota bacterium]
MEKEQIALKMSERTDVSKCRESRIRGGANRLAWALSLVAAVLAVLPVKATAVVQFDGSKCYLSQKSESLQLTDQGYLQWNAPGPQQLIVRLDEMPLVKTGDIAEVRYLYRVDGRVPQAANFRIGLFDSNGKGHVRDDGYGLTNDIWKGYQGYYALVFPHIGEDTKSLTEDGKVKLPGKMINRTNPDSPTLLDADAGSQISLGISGFDAPLGRFVPLFVKVKRTSPNTVHVSVMIDNVTYLRIEEGAAVQLSRVDVLSIHFPEQWPHASVTLAPISAAKSLLKPSLRPASMRHVDVYKEPGRFAGWPAGYGANQWIWGNEIMVSFKRGYYKFSPTSHTIDSSKPRNRWQARSLDGGETWTLERP